MKKYFLLLMAVLILASLSFSDADAKRRRSSRSNNAPIITDYHFRTDISYYDCAKRSNTHDYGLEMKNDTEGVIDTGYLTYEIKVKSRKGNRVIMEFMGLENATINRYVGTVTVNPSDSTVARYHGTLHYITVSSNYDYKTPFDFKIEQ